MSNNFSQNYGPELAGTAVEVAGGLIGKSLIDSLRKSFTSSSQVQRGDYFMDQSRVLLQNHLQLIQRQDKTKIHRKYQRLRKVKEGLDNHDGSKFQKFLKARKYRRVSKETYEIIKDASDRGIDNHLMNQIAEATRLDPPGSGSGSGPETSTVGSDPFSDSHGISRISEVSVNDLDRIEMSTYHVDTTDRAAIVLDLVAQDESVQHVVATFSTEAFSGDRTDSGASQSIAPEAPAALSLHQDDGSSPRLIAASIPDVSEEREDEQAETCTLDSFTASEIVTSEGNRPHQVMGASVHPADGDTYTRSFAPRRPM